MRGGKYTIQTRNIKGEARSKEGQKMGYNKRIFNLGDTPYRTASTRARRVEESEQSEAQYQSMPKIPRGVSDESANESPIGSLLIRIILCITIFSALMLMKNSADTTVSICYKAIKAWSSCNYSIPEEYGIEKFVAAIKSGDLQSVFSPNAYPAIRFPAKGNISVHYGDKSSNGAPCLGIIIESDEPNDIIASIEGSVSDIGENEALGKYVTIENDNGVSIIYGCCEDIIVAEGDVIDTDTIIAKMSLGKDNKYYLYMEVQSNGNVINPEKCFSESV